MKSFPSVFTAKNWTRRETNLLLEVLELNWDDYNDNTKKNDPILKKIREKIESEVGTTASNRQINTKISNLRQTYYRRKEKSSESGSGTQGYWPYETPMSRLLGEYIYF